METKSPIFKKYKKPSKDLTQNLKDAGFFS